MKTILKLSFVRTLSWVIPTKNPNCHINLYMISLQTIIQVIWMSFTHVSDGFFSIAEIIYFWKSL